MKTYTVKAVFFRERTSSRFSQEFSFITRDYLSLNEIREIFKKIVPKTTNGFVRLVISKPKITQKS